MTRNMGSADRIIRIIIGILLIAFWILGITKGVLAIVLGLVGIVFLATSSVSFCPLYTIFGIRTCPAKR